MREKLLRSVKKLKKLLFFKMICGNTHMHAQTPLKLFPIHVSVDTDLIWNKWHLQFCHIIFYTRFLLTSVIFQLFFFSSKLSVGWSFNYFVYLQTWRAWSHSRQFWGHTYAPQGSFIIVGAHLDLSQWNPTRLMCLQVYKWQRWHHHVQPGWV